MKTLVNEIQSEFDRAMKNIDAGWSVQMGPYAGSYAIITGCDADGEPVYSDCSETIIREHFTRIIDLSTDDDCGGFSNITYRITPHLVVTIDDNDNYFELSDKSDDQIISELRASYRA